LAVEPGQIAPPPLAPLGSAFTETPIDSKDYGQLVRRLVYLWEEEDLRNELIFSEAMRAMRWQLPTPLLFQAVLDYRSITEKLVLQKVLFHCGWYKDETLSDEQIFAHIAETMDRYPASMGKLTSDQIKCFKDAGLLSPRFKQ
ncbi:MAG: hypothetical protein P8179_08880, partial [Candidatus Thiodiazotropha sp.]